MKTLILRTNRIDPDPRVEKEANTLLAIPRMEVSAVVWDRGETVSYTHLDVYKRQVYARQ